MTDSFSPHLWPITKRSRIPRSFSSCSSFSWAGTHVRRRMSRRKRDPSAVLIATTASRRLALPRVAASLKLMGCGPSSALRHGCRVFSSSHSCAT
jgi:hypothetical protein